MTGKFADKWARALAQVAAAGVAVTFSKSVPGSYDPSTDASTAPVVTTVTGKAVRTSGNPQTYLALELIEAEAPTLFFVPDTYGVLPQLGMSVVWGGTTFNVADGGISPIAPDGVAIAARVVVRA